MIKVLCAELKCVLIGRGVVIHLIWVISASTSQPQN